MAHGGNDGLEHRRREKEIGEVGIELRATPFLDPLGSLLRAAPFAVPPAEGYGVERIGNRDDSRGKGDAHAAQLRRITASIPPLVVREDSRGQIGIEAGKGSEHLRAALRMGADRAALLGTEGALLMDEIEERLVNLPDVVEECYALDDALGMLVEIGGIGEDECVSRDASHVGTGLGVVRVDGSEERFEQRAGRRAGDQWNRVRKGHGMQQGKKRTASGRVTTIRSCGVCADRVRWEMDAERATREDGPFMRCRRRPTLPRPLGRSTIGAVGLNDRVRDGNGCGPYALVASDDAAERRGYGCTTRRAAMRSAFAELRPTAVRLACSASESKSEKEVV